MAHHTGQPLYRIERDTERDYFMSGDEAKEYGIIDEVIVRGTEKPKESKSWPDYLKGVMARQVKSEANLRCSFCGKSRDQVRKLIAGRSVYICD